MGFPTQLAAAASPLVGRRSLAGRRAVSARRDCARRRAVPPAWWLGVLGAALAVLLAGGRAGAQTKLTPLSDSDTEILSALPDEKPYNVRIHFLRSNERRHDVFFPALRQLGGGYIGVGADQNYTLAAVARAELLWLIDIDGDVVQ